MFTPTLKTHSTPLKLKLRKITSFLILYEVNILNQYQSSYKTIVYYFSQTKHVFRFPFCISKAPGQGLLRFLLAPV